MSLTGKWNISPEDRLFARVEKTETCWLWTGRLAANPYPQIMVEGRTWAAHRWVYSRFVGPIPEGFEVDHICGVKRCVRPEHLEAKTASENVRAHWRDQRGSCRNGHDMTDPANVVWRLRGSERRCRTCERARQSRWRAKQV